MNHDTPLDDDICSHMYDLDKPCTEQDLSEHLNMMKSPEKQFLGKFGYRTRLFKSTRLPDSSQLGILPGTGTPIISTKDTGITGLPCNASMT